MSITIDNGGLATQDPDDSSVYQFDWGTDNLALGVTIMSSVFTVRAVNPLTAVLPVLDSAGLDGASRTAHVRVTGGDVGATYEIANKIVTSESPSQTKERSFLLLIEES